ncbi:NAD-dependent epimerase/dehydratase family protein [Subtercola sp. YIM 133946]|uniref:NAD-dependent epimerase/dehydratase family protein n=1 Tax=Subtercola sp. YIM 133946 TaxID=3118909 RepID=UPI002F91E598
MSGAATTDSHHASGDRGLLLVTGGAGFIGRAIVSQALDAGWRVRVLDSLRPDVHAPRPAATAGVSDPVFDDPRVDFRLGDVTDEAAVTDALQGVSVVSHQAAKVGLGVDFLDAPDYVHTNELGTAVLLAAMTRAGIERLVLASSMVVYGEGKYRRAAAESAQAPVRASGAGGLSGARADEHDRAKTDEHCASGAGERSGVESGSRTPALTVRPAARRVADLEAGRFDPVDPDTGEGLAPDFIVEDDPLDPRNVYASSKLAQEHLAAAWARSTGGRVAALRYHNVYGPGMPQNTPYAGVASLFRSALQRGEAPRVFEDGAQRRDFVHVRDVASANLAAIDFTARPGGAEVAADTGGEADAAAHPAGADSTEMAADTGGEAMGRRSAEGAPDASAFRAFNVGSGVVHTIGDLAAALSRFSNGPAPVVTGEYRLGDVRHITASSDRLRTELGWAATVSFDDGVREFATAPLRAAVAAAPTTTPAPAPPSPPEQTSHDPAQAPAAPASAG